MTELKPCPFCGSYNLAEGNHSPFVICDDCGAFGPGNADLTHDEAVEKWNARATLGGGKMTADDVRDLIERHSDASGGNGRDFHNGAYVAIADELNAALGGGECEMQYATEGAKRGWWVCSECGEASDTIKSCAGRKPPNYCGNCGKAAKR